ncbi:MAG: DnaA regulatory inactivator Hda [Enterobacterales bacterium]|nr:DnaA regulatory inactivator Hda [Enterobacterales bacterium]
MLQLSLDVQLDASAQFQTFYAGQNQQAVSRLMNLDLTQPEFLYIWGASACGKTHLAQSLCKQVSEKGLAVAYLPLDYPALEPEVLQGLESTDLVCLDAIDVVAANPAWEEAIFHLFNLLKSANKSLVIFGCNTPKASHFILADLESRLNAMEVYRIKPLLEAEKPEFLKQCGIDRGLELSDEVIGYILLRANREVGDLTQLIQRLDKESLAHQRKITIPFIKKQLGW